MVRPYAPFDADALWERKRGFETGLGAGTGGDEKQATYEAKLTDDYREEWLDWVARCVGEQERAVQVAEAETVAESETAADAEDGDSDDAGDIAGYVFVLPESLAYVWDAAVLNEIYVAPAYRGTGVADDLMDAALEFARDQDLPLDRLVLDVDRENERAQAFYDRYGFEHWGEMVARDL